MLYTNAYWILISWIFDLPFDFLFVLLIVNAVHCQAYNNKEFTYLLTYLENSYKISYYMVI